MRRSMALLLTIGLALASALALLRAAAVVADVPRGDDPAAVNETLVRRYYAVANALIATGDAGGLDAVVDADLLLFPSTPESEADVGRDVLVGRLEAIHATQPNLRLDVREVVADEDVVVARVAIAGATPGLPPAVQPSRFEEDWLDGFRIRGGKIAAMWGATSGLSAPTSVMSAAVEAPGASAFVGLTRLTLRPSEEPLVLVGHGPMLLVPESGTVRARIDGTGQLTRAAGDAAIGESTARGHPIAVGPGDRLTLRAGVPVRLDSTGAEPAVVLVAVAWPPSAIESIAFTNSGVTPRPLAVDMFQHTADDAPGGRADRSWQPLVSGTVSMPADRIRLGAERVVVALGGIIPAFRPAGAMLLGVERGTAAVSTGQGPSDDPATTSTVGSGGASSLEAGIAATIHNVGDAPAVVVAITVLASNPDGESS